MAYQAVRQSVPDPIEDLKALARQAATMFGAPMALISMIGDDRKWRKIPVGLDQEQTRRVTGFCTDAVASAGVSVAEDARRDPCLGHYEAVTAAPRIRFFAGAPLRQKGHRRFGTICVMDSERHNAPTYQALRRLTDVANRIVDVLEKAGDGLAPPTAQ